MSREQDRSISSHDDFSDRDYLSISLDQVKATFARFELLDETIEFLKGWFSDTPPSAKIDQISLLRLDGDLYESTRDAIIPLYDKVRNSGYIIVDDYNSWPGCKKAIDEFPAHRGINTPLVVIDAHAAYWRRKESEFQNITCS